MEEDHCPCVVYAARLRVVLGPPFLLCSFSHLDQTLWCVGSGTSSWSVSFNKGIDIFNRDCRFLHSSEDFRLFRFCESVHGQRWEGNDPADIHVREEDSDARGEIEAVRFGHLLCLLLEVLWYADVDGRGVLLHMYTLYLFVLHSARRTEWWPR